MSLKVFRVSSVRKSAEVFPELVPPDVHDRAGPKLVSAVIDQIDLGPALAFVLGTAAALLFLAMAG